VHARTSSGPAGDRERPRLPQLCNDVTTHRLHRPDVSKATGPGATLPVMSVQRVACPSPWGEDHELLVLGDRVVVPSELGHMRSLRWLDEEQHPRLAVTTLCELERETCAELGLSPYCVPIDRWNEAADCDPWLPHLAVTPASASEASGRAGSKGLRLPHESVFRAVDPVAALCRIGGLDRLRDGSASVRCLFGGVRAVVRAAVHGAAALACLYYVVAAASWMFGLCDGMDGMETQEGVVLVLAAVVFSAVTGLLLRAGLPTPRGQRVVLRPSDARERQPLVYTALDAYRLGISLQLLAFGAFVVF
jgi:hypothetical protein